MSLDNKNVAYDFSLFEKSPKLTKDNVLQLRENNQRIKRKSKVKYRTISLMLTAITIGTSIIGSMVYGQVQLNEVTAEINQATTELKESESLHTQLQVKVESKLSLGLVEEYARNHLHMEKINPCQIEYITLSTEDKGEVQKKGLNMFDKIHNCLHKE